MNDVTEDGQGEGRPGRQPISVEVTGHEVTGSGRAGYGGREGGKFHITFHKSEWRTSLLHSNYISTVPAGTIVFT